MIQTRILDEDLGYAITEMDQYHLDLTASALESLADLTANLDPTPNIKLTPEKLSPLLRLMSLNLEGITHRASKNIIRLTFAHNA